MPGSPQRRQKAIERKSAKRKEKKRALAKMPGEREPTSQRGTVRAAAHWSLHEVLISEGWNQTAELPGLTQVLVARRSPHGEVGMASFLVDLGCLGVKNAMGKVFSFEGEYAQAVRRIEAATQRLVPVNLDLAAKVVQEGIAYARSLGFQPHRDYFVVAPFLEGAHPEACPTKIPLGYQGKPFYASGPYDNPKKIVDKLAKTVGVGNFDYVVEVSPSELVIDADELNTD